MIHLSCSEEYPSHSEQLETSSRRKRLLKVRFRPSLDGKLTHTRQITRKSTVLWNNTHTTGRKNGESLKMRKASEFIRKDMKSSHGYQPQGRWAGCSVHSERWQFALKVDVGFSEGTVLSKTGSRKMSLQILRYGYMVLLVMVGIAIESPSESLTYCQANRSSHLCWSKSCKIQK